MAGQAHEAVGDARPPTGMGQMSHHERNHPTHLPPVERFNEPIVLMITVCSVLRDNIFNRDRVHSALVTAWQAADQWKVGYYVLMPDHVHLFCIPSVFNPLPVKNWVHYWKRVSSNIEPFLKGCWQRDFWDTQMRNRDHYQEKVHYVQMNPVRKSLVKTPEEWPYKGECHRICW
jgi:putative transposase